MKLDLTSSFFLYVPELVDFKYSQRSVVLGNFNAHDQAYSVRRSQTRYDDFRGESLAVVKRSIYLTSVINSLAEAPVQISIAPSQRTAFQSLIDPVLKICLYTAHRKYCSIVWRVTVSYSGIGKCWSRIIGNYSETVLSWVTSNMTQK